MKGRAVLGVLSVAVCGLVVFGGPIVAAGASGGSAAAAAPLVERAGDPVVFRAEQAAGVIGAEPTRVAAYSWDGRWVQVPVQVDERKTVDVRDLYPTPGPPYVRLIDTGFALEVYADPDTRTGADPDPRIDVDDEIALMSQDVGGFVRPGSVVRPAGTTGNAVEVQVSDPVSGNRGAVYLYRTLGQVDQSAGRSYVNYDFRPLYLAPGQRLGDGYRYLNSPNPEDSTVSTDFYEIHATDRWMDDELRVRASGASGADILDREVAQATRTSCGRSELTFSGNWTAEDRGGDSDEGTFVTVKSGPVRAIRDYMGANSGPYTQRQHIYYEQREDTTTFLRVHPMLDLYTWTDWSSAAVGMTYRNKANPAGVTVDGSPDALAQPPTTDFTGGATFWESITGPQGSITTIASAETDIPNASFGSYYLDDSNAPLTGNRRQCAGDGLSYGASGFGILGPVTPNTDPRLPTFNRLTVKRVRYFSSPGEGATGASVFSDRVARPLEVTSGVFSPKRVPQLDVRIKPLKARITGTGRASVVVRVRNSGEAVARRVRVCVIPDDGQGACRMRASLGAGRSMRPRVPVRVPGIRPGSAVWAVVKVTGAGADAVRMPFRLTARSR